MRHRVDRASVKVGSSDWFTASADGAPEVVLDRHHVHLLETASRRSAGVFVVASPSRWQPARRALESVSTVEAEQAPVLSVALERARDWGYRLLRGRTNVGAIGCSGAGGGLAVGCAGPGVGGVTIGSAGPIVGVAVRAAVGVLLAATVGVTLAVQRRSVSGDRRQSSRWCSPVLCLPIHATRRGTLCWHWRLTLTTESMQRVPDHTPGPAGR